MSHEDNILKLDQSGMEMEQHRPKRSAEKERFKRFERTQIFNGFERIASV